MTQFQQLLPNFTWKVYKTHKWGKTPLCDITKGTRTLATHKMFVFFFVQFSSVLFGNTESLSR